jgi:hypothetical protein
VRRRAWAARTLARKVSTSRRSVAACTESSPAAPSICPEAARVSLEASVTPAMLLETSCVPRAACCTLRAIS